MAKSNTVTIFTIPNYDGLFELKSIDVKLVTMPLQDMVKVFLETGKENDICMLPYISQYKNLLATFRAKQRRGAIVFVTNKPVEPKILDDIYRRGALLIDVNHERPIFVKFLLLFLAEALQRLEGDGYSEYIQVAMTLEQSYRAQREPTREPESPPPSSDVHNLLEEATEVPEKLPFLALLKDKERLDPKFVITFDSKVEGTRTVSLSCMACLKGIKSHPLLTKHPVLIFRDFQPGFASELLIKMVGQSDLQTLTTAVASKVVQPESTVQLSFVFKGNNRNCIAMPVLIENNVLGFLPLGDAFIQKRRFVRVEPSTPEMITTFVTVEGLPTQNCEVIDISEQGLAFWFPARLSLATEVIAYIHWNEINIVTKGVVRLSAEIKERNKIGIELIAHDQEYARLGEQIFRYQIEMCHRRFLLNKSLPD
ncbi:MAG: hypothetical protein A2511_17685 [Deltaproteobacteria bacterium RIFOXYD12_FULL_50_9]|nr:MAG: hypothetical protein A2511_17685 [Deltaproteobacteria bacterium RIFOXYD12_FULL_50_9]